MTVASSTRLLASLQAPFARPAMIRLPGTLRLVLYLLTWSMAMPPSVQAFRRPSPHRFLRVPSPAFGEIPLHPPFVEPGVDVIHQLLQAIEGRIVHITNLLHRSAHDAMLTYHAVQPRVIDKDISVDGGPLGLLPLKGKAGSPFP
jgi:hypothetical protein